jgi:molybdopterin synthase catalytic subunit
VTLDSSPRGKIHVAICEEKIEMKHEELLQPAALHGGENIFLGRVRKHNQGKIVEALSYDSFAPLCEKVFVEMAEEAQDKWGRDMNVLVLHRVGRLEIGETAVLIAVSSKHRDESYQASRYIIENLKQRAPIWKKEHYTDGDSEWLQGHALCQHDHSHPHGHAHQHG